MNVRDAGEADVPAIRDVAVASWHAAHDHVIGQEAVDRMMDEWYDPADLREQVAREAGHFLVVEPGEDGSDSAVRDADPVGFAHAGPSEEDDWGDAVLSRIYVHPDRWGDGAGSALLAETTDRLRDDGHDRLWLAVMADNDVGVSFYRSQGFEVVEERVVELADQDVADYVMARDL